MKKLLTILFAVALGLNLSAQTDYVDDWNPDADGDDLIGITDLLALLSLFAEADSDGDGIWDSVDDCIGVYDPCGVCNGTGEDVDEDGLCDDVDDCVGAYDECGVCNGPGPTFPVIDEILYATDSVFLDPLDEWYVFEYATDTLFTYVCPVSGCTDETAGNYNPEAVIEDGSCVYGPLECGGVSTVTYDGYTYDLVAIGDQCWFAENLRSEHYANGDAIPSGLDDSDWDSTITGASAVSGNEQQGSLYVYLSSNLESGWGGNSIVVSINDEIVGNFSSESGFTQFEFEITELDEIQIEYVEIDALSTPFLSLTLYNCGYDNGIEINELNAGVIYNSDAACEYGASEYLNSYGRLYNWYAVDDARGLCPSGWHVPTDEEFMTLEMELGMSESEANDTGWRGTDQGTQMKSSAGDHRLGTVRIRVVFQVWRVAIGSMTMETFDLGRLSRGTSGLPPIT